MSAVTGTGTAAAILAMAANISPGGAASPSSNPRLSATAALPVATTGNPASTTARALAASQALGSTSGRPGTWSDRSNSAFVVRSPATGHPP